MTFSDGKPSLLFETTEEAKELEDKSIMEFTVAIATPGSDASRLMQDLATEHVPNNERRDPGLDELQVGVGPFEREAIEFVQQQRRPHTPWIKRVAGQDAL